MTNQIGCTGLIHYSHLSLCVSYLNRHSPALRTIQSSMYTDCTDVHVRLHVIFSGWMKATQAMEVLGTLAGFAATAAVFMCAFVEYVGRNRLAHFLTMLANFMAGTFTTMLFTRVSSPHSSAI